MDRRMKILLCSLLLMPFTLLAQEMTLKNTVGKHFMIGSAMNIRQIDGMEPNAVGIARKHFNSIVAENCMKPEKLEPEEGVFFWEDADRFVKFGNDNGMRVIGHVLVWHSQTAPWMFKNKHGELPNREEMISRLRNYIMTVVGRYKGRVFGWDVANECFLDDGSYRNSPWFRSIGPDFIKLAFQFAHEADPDAELYYNDYSMNKPGKRRAVINLINELRAAGCRIDAVGMQSHNGLSYPNLTDYENTMKALVKAGVKINISELDINMLPNPEGFGGADINLSYSLDPSLNPYANGLTKGGEQLFTDRCLDFFRLYYEYRKHIDRVCTWGISDGDSWLNDWPVNGRTNYPLLFDRKYKAKAVVKEIARMFGSNSE